MLHAGRPAPRSELSSNERAQQRQAVDLIQQHCKSFQAWGTSLVYDQELLSNGTNMSDRNRQAIAARIEHKLLVEAANTVLQVYKDSLGDAVILGGLLRR